MPVYPYECMACQHAFDEIQTMADTPLLKCPVCGADALRRLFGLPNAVVRGSPKCIGQLAEDNTRKLRAKHGKEKAERIIHERTYGKGGKKMKLPKGASPLTKPAEIDIPWFRSGEVPGTGPCLEKPLDVTTVKNAEKYIRTGEKT